MSRRALIDAHEQAVRPYDREHVTPVSGVDPRHAPLFDVLACAPTLLAEDMA